VKKSIADACTNVKYVWRVLPSDKIRPADQQGQSKTRSAAANAPRAIAAT
jgi:hypothetical protein